MRAIKNQRVAVRYIQSLRVRNTRIQMCGIVEVNEILATRLKSIGSKFHFFPPWFFNVVSSVLIRNWYRHRSGQADRRYGNNGARRSSGGPIGVGGALVVPGLCWETRTSLYRLRWRRRVVPGSRLGRHQPRHGGRRRWRYSAKLRIQYRRTRLILSAHRLTLPPSYRSRILFGIPLFAHLLYLSLFFSLTGLPRKKRRKQFNNRSFISQKFLSLFFTLFFYRLFSNLYLAISLPCFLSGSCSRVISILEWVNAYSKQRPICRYS